MSCNGRQTASSRRRAKRLNLYIEQGADFVLPIVYREDGEPVDLTGATIEAQLREKVNSANALISLGTASGTISIVPLEGRVIMRIDAAQTENFKIYRGVWDMRVTMPDGERFRLLTGEFEVGRGVTR